MLFLTDYPAYQDPIGGAHDYRPHPLQHGLQNIAEYIKRFFVMILVTAFTGMEFLLVVVLAILLLQGISDWNVLEDLPSSVAGTLRYLLG
ncbi:MAG: hypothetical protein WCD07_03605 [Burkholderiales bacterium]